ncbi:hypothetical protein DNL40_11150 [Xylanimonas oleitrophica]|uniref:4'-phosphopantetheinyl transferase domain-containing protein n=1 Tax=Xylanimonas oleitrophica TaxID=2607479 RepID=A0A2W5XS78_9MICO|nr:4'-phosphopantetheinyl transferase superfamily protein [Xylanimonas oleitrophica]PZR52658.1 hypothetical protein DNL40_11150 [Xylanimonas oleitrophica]
MSLLVLPAPAGTTTPAALLAAVLRDAGVPGVGAEARVVRRCVTCGEPGHGKPEVPAALAAGWHVSLAHTATWLVVAASDGGPVGVDVEQVAAVAAHPVADVLLSPDERAAGHLEDAAALTRTWVRKEALLKATGHGLAVPPSSVTLRAPGGDPGLLVWDVPDAAVPRPVAWSETTLGDGDRLALVTAVALAPS